MLNPVKSLRRRRIRGIIHKINDEIKYHEHKIEELAELKTELKKANSDSSAKIVIDEKLSLSDTKRLALEAYHEYGELSVDEVAQKVKEDTNLNIKVSTARIAVNALDSEGKIVQTKSGKWKVV